MKRSIAILLSVLVFIGIFAACSSDEKKEINISALSQELLDSAAFPGGLEAIDMENGCYLYGIDCGEGGNVVDAAFYLATGAVADEIAIIKTTDETAASEVKDAIAARVEYLKGSFESYNPAEVPQLENAFLKTSGIYVVFVCAEDQAAADAILKAYI